MKSEDKKLIDELVNERQELYKKIDAMGNTLHDLLCKIDSIEFENNKLKKTIKNKNKRKTLQNDLHDPTLKYYTVDEDIFSTTPYEIVSKTIWFKDKE